MRVDGDASVGSGDRVVIVTGSEGLLGREIARDLAASGDVVIGWDTRGEPPVDVSDLPSVQAALRKVLARHPRIDGLVHAAAWTGRAGLGAADFLDLDLEQWRRVLDVNLTGAFITGQQVARAMVGAPDPSVVMVASVQGLLPTRGRVDYSVAKAGMLMLTRMMAGELAPMRVRVNAVVPGPIGAEEEADRPEATPLGFMGAPSDVSALVRFLLSGAARFMTGGIYPVDGGLTAGFRQEVRRG